MKKILVIEDMPEIREELLNILNLKGFQTYEAENGEAGVEATRIHLPDLILCDVNMPVMDGYEVIEKLRESPDTASIPFIFLTALTEKKDLRKGMDLGADDYLTKPFTAKELISAVDSRFNKYEVFQTQNEKNLNELRDSIALALPHELRTPLNGIINCAELIINASCDKQNLINVKKMAELIFESGKRLHNLIENFLIYAQIELKARDPQKCKIFREYQISNCCYIIENSAKAIAVKNEREDDLFLDDLIDANTYISEDHLKKIVDEIVNNAFNYSKKGTPVTIKTKLTDNSYDLIIMDVGRGMKQQQIQHVGAYMQFERKFYEQQGTGLGLIISKRLAELHGGNLSIESKYEEYTIVTISLQI